MEAMSSTNSTQPFANLRGLAPAELTDFLTQFLLLFPVEFQERVHRVIETIPASGDTMQRVLEVVRAQWQGIQSEHWIRISLVGPSQTGKTTLLKSILKQQSPHTPDIFSIEEIPGLSEYLGYESTPLSQHKEKRADLTVLVLDAQYEVSGETKAMLDAIRTREPRVLVVLNKCDLVVDPGEAVRRASHTLQQRVVPVSAADGGSLRRLLRAIIATEEEALYPLALAFPRLRSQICRGIVTQSSIACAVVAAIPIPVSDLLPITAIQSSMLLKLARTYGHRLDRGRVLELGPMLLSGLAVREASHRLRRQFPRQAKLIGVSASGAWTYLLGRAAIAYFDRFSALLEEGETATHLPAANLQRASEDN